VRVGKTDRPTTSGCIRAAIELELRSASLYRALAERFSGHAWLRLLLDGLTEEEQQHAMRIRMLERVHPASIWKPEDLPAFSTAIQAALARTMEVEETIARSGQIPPLSVLEAVRRLEAATAGAHAEALARSAAPDVRGLFESLATQDRHHGEVLERACARLAEEGPPPAPATQPSVIHLG
jgi:rubrerythrin